MRGRGWWWAWARPSLTCSGRDNKKRDQEGNKQKEPQNWAKVSVPKVVWHIIRFAALSSGVWVSRHCACVVRACVWRRRSHNGCVLLVNYKALCSKSDTHIHSLTPMHTNAHTASDWIIPAIFHLCPASSSIRRLFVHRWGLRMPILVTFQPVHCRLA